MTTETTKQTQCPSCRTSGKRVGTTTLKAMLKDELMDGIQVEQTDSCDQNDSCANVGKSVSADTGWRFCDSPDCDVVYFSEDGERAFTKSQLKVSVGVKEKTGERPLCYCFKHSVSSIKEELQTDGKSEALEDIRAKMNDPGCRCETENPSGSCCLGSVGNGITTAKKELKMNDAGTQTSQTPTKSSGSKGEKIAKIGTLVSAIMASSCCWLPLVLLAVGVSGAGIASTLEAYRPLFMVVTFGFLGAAFYFTYRPKKAATTGGDGCCATEPTSEEDCCTPATKGRFNMMSLNKVMLWGVTVMAVAFLFFPSYVGALFDTGDENAVTSDMRQTVIKIEGMTCEGCATTVAQAIRRVPGILAVEVSYEKREAVIGTSPSESVPKSEIVSALKRAGYSGRILDDEENTDNEASPNPASNKVSQDQGSLARLTLSVSGMT